MCIMQGCILCLQLHDGSPIASCSLTRSSNPIDGAFSVNLTNKLAGRMITTGYIYSYHFRKPPNKP